MNIITDNYIWFIIGGCVLLLITIGYYAEQTGFGKVKLNTKNKSEIIVDDSVGITETININEDAPIEEPLIISDDISNLEKNNDVSIPELKENIINQENLPETAIPNTTNITSDEDIWKF